MDMFPRHEKHEEAAEWGRLATKHSKDNIDLSIEYLRKIWHLGMYSDYHASIKQLERLPKYLQKAGKGEEALRLCFELLALLPERAAGDSSSHPIGIEFKLSCERADMYDCLRLIYKREKNTDKEKHFIKLRDEERVKREKLQDKYFKIQDEQFLKDMEEQQRLLQPLSDIRPNIKSDIKHKAKPSLLTLLKRELLSRFYHI